MVFVSWTTVVDWKSMMRDAAAHGGTHPYQYSSDSARFLKIEPQDVLWVVSTPRFGSRGEPTRHGRARPPAVMARLRVAKVCCNRGHEDRRTAEGRKRVCLGTDIAYCDEPGVLEEGVHPASNSWSIVTIGQKDPVEPEPLQVTYPMLYNIFGILHRLEFITDRGVTDLQAYLEFVERGQYLNATQLRARDEGRPVRNPGPYARFGQVFQTLRKLTPAAGATMNAAHTRAVQGRRVFLSYKWEDVERFAAAVGQTRADWLRELERRLDEAGYSSWLDHHQIPDGADIAGLLDEVLADAVRQSVVFVALLSDHYGTGWTLEEWNLARAQLRDENRRDSIVPIVLDCGGDPRRLGWEPSDTVPVGLVPTPDDVVRAIEDTPVRDGRRVLSPNA